MKTAAAPSHRRLLGVLGIALAASTAFSFALVPLYDVFCRLTGLNGKQYASAALPPTGVDRSRTVAVEFVATVMPGLPVELRPLQPRVTLHPGELRQVAFAVRNLSAQPLVTQAVPSFAPGLAARHVRKIECFCFRQQALAPGEARTMPLVFMVDRELGADVPTITLSYALYGANATNGAVSRSSPGGSS